VLLMDEPLAHLDPPHQADWIALARAQAAAGVLVVSVLHELGVALQADELVLLRAGRVVHHGPTGSASTHQALRDVFDQRVAVHPVAGQWVALPRSQPGAIPSGATPHAD
jgi:iron complex transport system ATP-binding protein